MSFGGSDMAVKSIEEELMVGQKNGLCGGMILKMKVEQQLSIRFGLLGGVGQLNISFVLKFFRPKK